MMRYNKKYLSGSGVHPPLSAHGPDNEGRGISDKEDAAPGGYWDRLRGQAKKAMDSDEG